MSLGSNLNIVEQLSEMTNGALVYVFVTMLATCNCCASNTFTFEFMQSILDP